MEAQHRGAKANRLGLRATSLLLLLFTALTAVPCAAQNIEDNDDILQGQTYLVRSDDLVVADPAFISGTTDMTKVEYFPLDTDNMLITTSGDVSATNLATLSCTAKSPSNEPFPQQTQAMRLFNQANDVIVTFAPTEGASGDDCSNQEAGEMTFYVDDPVAKTHDKFVVSGDIRNRWLHSAVADFDGDGFDDLFITTDEWTYVATAVDPNTPSSGIHIVASLETGGSMNPLNDPTIGDFNADGNLDVAWAGTGFSSGDTPAVFMLTVCSGSIKCTVCDGADPFAIKGPIETINPSAPSGSLVEVGGDCVKNEANQTGSELRAPAMAVAAGAYDTTTPGDELVIAALYEASNKDCKVAAESYSFTQFGADIDSQGQCQNVVGKSLTSTQAHVLDDLGPHGHIGHPSSIYAQAGNLDWSSKREYVAMAISGDTDENVLVLTFDNTLLMTSTDAPFSTDHNKSFAGFAIGRFSAAPGDGTPIDCTQDSDCTDTCSDKVCEQSGMACTANGDCQGSCTSYGLCSYTTASQYNLQIATFLMAHSSSDSSSVYIYASEPPGTAPKQLQQFNVDNFVQTATDRAIRAGSLLRAGDIQGRSVRLGNPTVVRINGSVQPDIIVNAPPMQVDWLPFAPLHQSQFCASNQSCAMLDPANLCNCTDNLIPDTSCAPNCTVTDVTCADGTPVRCLMNISGLTSNYTAQYSFMEGQTTSTTTTENTSWSLGASIKLSEETSELSPIGVKVSQKVTFAAGDTYNHSVSTTNSNYDGSSLKLNSATQFDDYVWYTTRQYNVYYYPVIGQEVCVDSCTTDGVCSISGGDCTDNGDCPNDQTDTTNCTTADMQQLYVQYSGDVSVQTTSASTQGKEWYQPIHEPGQVLSYPWNCSELQSRYGVELCDPNDLPEDSSASLLATSPTVMTDDTPGSFSLEWTAGKGSSRSTNKGGQFSESLSETITASTPSYESVVAGAKLKEEGTINSSQSISTVRTNSTDLDSSTGIVIGQPGTFLDPTTFQYGLQGYIFGDLPAKGTLQAPPDTMADSQVNGVVRSAFTVDVTGPDNFWTSGAYRSAVDVALNRPAHISVPPGKGTSSPATTQCLPVGQENDVTADCAQYEEPAPGPADLWNSSFYHLRGFFVTPASAPDQGPQLVAATEGDQLALQVRVYNYSLMDMNSFVGAKIKVDFYAQEFDDLCKTPAGYHTHTGTCTQAGTGAEISCENSCDPCCIVNQPVDSVYLGQDQLNPLPGFQEYEDTPNWGVAGITFDTGNPGMCPSGGCGDKYFVFWVVAWLEGQDANNSPVLVTELADHGLTGDLDALSTLKSIDDICPKASCDSSCGICMEEFTNNVGFYHVDFYVAPQTTEATLAPRRRPGRGSGAGFVHDHLAVDRVSVEPAELRRGQKAVVHAGLRALDANIDGQIVRFYAVPPGAGDLSLQEALERYGSFDEEILPHIRANRVHEAQVPFIPTDLGRYQILVSALEDGEEQLIGQVDLDVVETPPATPTSPPLPTATPVQKNGSDDDGCAISAPGNRASKGVIMLLIIPMLLTFLRPRRRR